MPAVLQLIRGNPGKRPLNLSDGVNPPIQIPAPPKWLSEHARKEWKRIGGELAKLALIAEIDKASLAIYCQTWGDLCDLEQAFAAQKRKVIEQTNGSDIGLMDVYFAETPTGFLRESVVHKKIVEMRAELDRYMRNFGLNPASRARVTASQGMRPALPGIEPAPGEESGFARFAKQQR